MINEILPLNTLDYSGGINPFQLCNSRKGQIKNSPAERDPAL
jgi:hypothetical protein